MKYAIVNCDVYTGDDVLYDKAIVVNEHKVEAIVEQGQVPKEMAVLDLKGVNIAPGFIDLQVNGGGGRLFNDDPSEECIREIYEAHRKFGTTNFLPTLISTSVEKMLQAAKAVRSCIKDGKYGVLGLHVEGPYIDPGKSGVHDKKQVRSATDDEISIICKEGLGTIKIFTAAPENMREEHVRLLKKNGIILSAGHSNATYDKAQECFTRGFSKVTHLFNAMSQLGSREPGLVGAALDADNVWAGIIVDGFHVHFANVRLAKIIKQNKLLLVTDAMPPVGSEISKFRLGDLTILVKDGKCVTEDGTLAGSALDMATAVRNCVQKVGIPLDEALRMASTYPAELLGIEKQFGRIRPGYLANLVIFSDQLTVKGTISFGNYTEVAK